MATKSAGGKRQTFSREDRLKAIRLIKGGSSADEAAMALGVETKYLRPYLLLSDLDKQLQMIHESDEGKHLADIAEAHNVTQRRVWQLVGSPATEQRDPNYRTLKLRVQNETVKRLLERGQRMRLSGSEEDIIGRMLDKTFSKD